MKTALITGIAGQDGAYLAKLLLSKGYKVIGARRHGSAGGCWRLNMLGIEQQVEMLGYDMLEDASIRRILDVSQPTEVYNLAAQSSIAHGLECPQYTAGVNGMGVLRLLEAIRATDPSIRFFQAGSSEMFGNVFGDVQNEYTEFRPRSPYGVAKLFAHWTAKNYRSLHGIHACNGILYNHTSRLQGSEFLASKVTKGMADIAQGRQQKIELGNLSAERDWGSAEDYVEAMWLMLQHPTPDDYVIATGSLVSVREFVELAARHVGIDIEWRGMGAEEQGLDRGTGNVIVSISPKFYRPSELGKLRGNASKALQTMGWRAKTSLTALVGSMTLSCCQ